MRTVGERPGEEALEPTDAKTRDLNRAYSVVLA
jgi:hypothetical protein